VGYVIFFVRGGVVMHRSRRNAWSMLC